MPSLSINVDVPLRLGRSDAVREKPDRVYKVNVGRADGTALVNDGEFQQVTSVELVFPIAKAEAIDRRINVRRINLTKNDTDRQLSG